MPRIPATEIERIKQEISLEKLVKMKGVELKKHGDNLIGLCPLHNDKEPSLVITPSKNLWHCLGACQTGGSVFDWVMKTEGVSFRQAYEVLRENLSTPSNKEYIGITDKVTHRSTVPLLPSPVDDNADEQKVKDQVIEYYHETLLKTSFAKEWLENRCIYDAETVKKFKLGFADKSIGPRLPQKNRMAGAKIRKMMINTGLFRSNGHEHLTGRIIIPIMDNSGNVISAYGRRTGKKPNKNAIDHLYLPGSHQTVWNPQCFENDSVILCESLIDALSFYVHGFQNVTASYGVSGFTKHHLKMIKDNNIQRIYIAYDRDEAGNRAAEKLSEIFIEENIETFRIQFPNGMDANEYVCNLHSEGKTAEESLQKLVNTAFWLGGSIKKISSVPPMPAPVHASSSNISEKHNQEKKKTENKKEISVNLPTTDVNCSVKKNEIFIEFSERKYRVRGLFKNKSYEVLRINLCLFSEETMYVDTIDLYNARQREGYIRSASEETGYERETVKKDMRKILLKLEEIQSEQKTEIKEDVHVMTEDEKQAAEDFLRSEDILKRIADDFNRCGIVGEKTNALTGYLAAISRKLDDPLAVIIQSSSSAGKTSLMDAVLAFIPFEERVRYTAITGQSLFYMGTTELKHKTLAISEEEGAERAAYAIKTFQSEKLLCIASTGKDPETGRMTTHEYRVEGPTQIMLTTTAVEINEELQNRCILLTVNENRDQTEAIHRMQRKKDTLEGILMNNNKEEIIKLHQNAQRLIRPLKVANNYAEHLTFINSKLRTRRDHEKYLTLIKSVALLRQYQKQIKTVSHNGKTIEYIEVDLYDIEAANSLAGEVLGRGLDELSPQTRRLLDMIVEMTEKACRKLKIDRTEYRFTRKDVRQYSGWTEFQVRIHIDRLSEMEYILTHRGKRGMHFVYELLYNKEGKDGKPFLMGLVDIKNLKEIENDESSSINMSSSRGKNESSSMLLQSS